MINSSIDQTGTMKAWWCKSIWSQLAMNKFGRPVRAHLDWDAAIGTVALVEVDRDEKPIRDIFRVSASELSQVEFKWTYFTFRVKGKMYTVAVRDDVIDRLILAGIFRNTSVYANIAAATIANKSGINKDMSGILQQGGVKVARIHVLRGVLLGLGIGILLIATFIGVIVFFYTH